MVYSHLKYKIECRFEKHTFLNLKGAFVCLKYLKNLLCKVTKIFTRFLTRKNFEREYL